MPLSWRASSDAGNKLWSAVGYGVLPNGHRSVLLERKLKIRHHRHQHDDDRHDDSRDPAR